MLVGLACGLVNGLVAQVIKIPVVVMTLATLGIYRALALALANGSPVGGLPENAFFFDWFGQGAVAQISYITILFLIVALIAEIVLRWTSSGFRLLAIGSNPQAARLVGFHVERTRVLLLAFSGLRRGPVGRLLGRLPRHREPDRRNRLRTQRACRRRSSAASS